jgi:histidinol dehydrogenase
VKVVRLQEPERRRGLGIDVAEPVARIIAAVEGGGDDALIDFARRFDGAELTPATLRVDASEIVAAEAAVGGDLLDALRTAFANVDTVARAQLRDAVAVTLAAGQRIEVAELPVARAAIYVPGGRAPYPSTVVMGAATARAAGVDEVVVAAPAGPEGIDPAILAACSVCGVTEVYRVGGAQAIAALAFGTESVRAVDVIVGPGSPYVQEAKRQVAWTQVGIDGIAGPSELVVLAAGAGVEPDLVALDLLAQAEHGADSPLWLVSPDPETLDAVERAVDALAPERESVTDALLQLVPAPDAQAALAVAERIAPEHLELVGADAEALAGEVRRAGCVFVGRDAGTAFGDYVAGSNHVLPTGGAARFQSALSVATFRRRMARVSLPGEAATRLAPAGATLARAEGFPVHAESMERRA